MIEHRIALDGYEICVHEQGSGPALMLGHSLTFDSAMWEAASGQLSDRFRVLRVDLPGHGASGHPYRDYTLEEMADDLAAVLDHLGIDRCGYAGHSMGGMVGMRFALAHPARVASLALLNTSAAEQEQPMRDLFHQVNESSRGKPSDAQTVKFVMGLMFSGGFMVEQPDKVAPFEQLLFEPTDGEGVYWAARGVIFRTNVLDRLSSLDLPTLVITSDGDTSVPTSHSQAIASSMTCAELINLGGAGHLTPIEREAEVTAALARHFAHLGEQA